LDGLLVAFVLVLTFLATTFAIRNTDIWQHLAAGRLLAQGNYHFGQDPFSYTTTDVYWANHAWLSDLILYGVTMLAGGPESRAAGIILVAGKALLFVLLAVLLLSIRLGDQRLWVPAVCMALAMLA